MFQMDIKTFFLLFGRVRGKSHNISASAKHAFIIVSSVISLEDVQMSLRNDIRSLVGAWLGKKWYIRNRTPKEKIYGDNLNNHNH